MFHTIAPSVLDRSKFMTLNEVARETNHSKLSIVRITPELVLDCRPMESSYIWLGVGIDNRRLHRMPELWLFDCSGSAIQWNHCSDETLSQR